MICIVGALAVDVLIHRDHFLKGTSNPSAIRFFPGGVGYRIYSHLGTQKMLFTALGSDVFGKWLIENMDQPQWVNPIFLDGYKTACYCALMQSGELFYGAADMSVVEEGLSWPRLRARLPELGPGDFLVLEANLSPELVRSLIHQLGSKTRVVFESVSVEKLQRHAGVLKNLYLLCGNEAELRALGRWFAEDGQAAQVGRSELAQHGSSPSSRNSRSESWVQEFLEQRKIEQLLVTRGRRGVRLFRRNPAGGERQGSTRASDSDRDSCRVPSQAPLAIPPGRIFETADSTGAGDRLLSAYLEALDREAGTETALRLAVQTVERSIQEGSL
jgi:sugar/nucleoside kinase (ribokinase family)